MEPLIHKVTWSSPSNIALVKYWGKRPVQMAMNSSLSLTLKNSVTTTSIERSESSHGMVLDFFFDKNVNEKFSKKIHNFLTTIVNDFPWLNSSTLLINSNNTFPHSSGIASSASSMSALVLCILSLDELITSTQNTSEVFFERASYYSRLASGSACRSLFPSFGLWKVNAEFALAYNDVHPMFLSLCDSILIVDEKEKTVSSTAGHSLMDSHPFKDSRYRDAENNLAKLFSAMKEGNFPSFSNIVEHEALSLHALMMTSSPSVILLRPESMDIILKVKEWRAETKIPITFTIDAGPNIHLLYPDSAKPEVRSFVDNILWPRKKVIHDEIGTGPKRIHYGK
jgi:diphosphomevalonate decarboxylase